jgi:hypothetical protein
LLLILIATNTHPWGQEITIHICHLEFHIDFSSTEKKRDQAHLFLGAYPKTGYRFASTNHDTPFLWLWPFA